MPFRLAPPPVRRESGCTSSTSVSNRGAQHDVVVKKCDEGARRGPVPYRYIHSVTESSSPDRSDESRQRRASSFGAVAEDYDRYRLGPIGKVADWILGDVSGRVVDVGAGTGAMARLLVGRAREVVAVEPDERMRAVLAANVPGVTLLAGHGEEIPLDDASVDAVVVSSAWHWMDPVATTAEIARVLHPGGVLGVVWSGLDWPASGFAEVRRLMRSIRDQSEEGATEAGGRAGAGGGAGAGAAGGAEGRRPEEQRHRLVLPPGAPFAPPERTDIRWTRSLNAEQLLGMLGTFSGVITLPEEQRQAVMAQAAGHLAERDGLRDDATIELPFRARCWRTRRD